jgi:hypothetical protein
MRGAKRPRKHYKPAGRGVGRKAKKTRKTETERLMQDVSSEKE